MATRKQKADWRTAEQREADRVIAAHAARRTVEEQIASERASVLARRTITTVRADGSRWTYTPPAVFTPRGKSGPQTPAEMLAKLESIRPHRDPKPGKPESIERYAARMARKHALPEVGIEVDNGERGQHYVGGKWTSVRDCYVRLPDDADEGQLRADADQIAADEERAMLAQIAAANAAEVAAADPAFDVVAFIEAPTIEAYNARERAVAAEVRAESRRAFYGAGAWSRRTRIPVIAMPEAA